MTWLEFLGCLKSIHYKTWLLITVFAYFAPFIVRESFPAFLLYLAANAALGYKLSLADIAERKLEEKVREDELLYSRIHKSFYS